MNNAKMKKVYVIKSHYYSDRNNQIFEDWGEFIAAVDELALEGPSAGRGEDFEIYEFEVSVDCEDVEEEIGNLAWKKNQTISYYNVWEIEDEDDENHGKYTDEIGEIYDNEDEAIEANKPSQYIFQF